MPMLLMGDEVRRTQRGTNNAYCQDNEISWFDWGLVERHADIHRFVTLLNYFRRRRDFVVAGRGLSLAQLLDHAQVEWSGVALGSPDWSDHSHSLAMTLNSRQEGVRYHAMFNAWWEPLTFELPPPADGRHWRRFVDTGLAPPDDIHRVDEAVAVAGTSYVLQPRSVVVLVQPRQT
jgi:glycogen operon protein